MRDLILLAVLLGICPMIFRAPILGVLTWIWIALMNPQREVYGLLAGAGLNFIVAALTIFAWMVSKERKTAPANLTMALLGLLLIWMCVSTYNALVPEAASNMLSRNLKTAAILLAVACIANTKMRLQAVIWTVVVSLAYFSVKGGAFVLASGGSYRVMGPDMSMIADNNHLGLALVMLLPLINYLRVTSQVRFVRFGIMTVMVLTVVAILGTYSRGALLALAAMGAVMAMRSRAGVLFAIAGIGLVFAAPHVMPEAWLERMTSIGSADQDDSFMNRVSSWHTNFHIATQRLTGGGFKASESVWVVQAYPTPHGLTTFGMAAHSIYFQVLGDLGFIGLALYLGLIGSAMINTVMVLQATRGRPDLRWANQLARMMQVSIVAYMVGGAALSMAYYDGFLLVIVLSAALHHIVKRGPAAEVTTSGPKWKAADAEATALPSPARPRLT